MSFPKRALITWMALWTIRWWIAITDSEIAPIDPIIHSAHDKNFDYIFCFELDAYTNRSFIQSGEPSFSPLFFLSTSLFRLILSLRFSLTFRRSRWLTTEPKKRSSRLPSGPFRSNAAEYESISTPNDPLRNGPARSSSREAWRHYDPWWVWNASDDWIPSSPHQHPQLARFLERKSVCACQCRILDDSLLEHLKPQKERSLPWEKFTQLTLNPEPGIERSFHFEVADLNEKRKICWKYLYECEVKVEHA